jgi:very-short-patch-repair endonuclease
LPVDPKWKSDYATTVKRLVCDGVEIPLANSFRKATVHSTEVVDTERARSLVEAFLYHRLETLAQTAGRFRLNADLQIPFNSSGAMEIDLLCTDARIAIEIDGKQHLHDANAYRRDRRKDILLQENGYIVLRFLAEDIGKYLDEVLDTILRVLVARARK